LGRERRISEPAAGGLVSAKPTARADFLAPELKLDPAGGGLCYHRSMHEQRTSAEQIARSQGLANAKGFRRWLRDRLPEHHEVDDWSAEIGSAKHLSMKRLLALFMRTHR
jgi:hypothetical protein